MNQLPLAGRVDVQGTLVGDAAVGRPLRMGRRSRRAGRRAVPVDDAFVVAGFAMFTLQLPSAWLLSIWRARDLRVVLRRNVGRTRGARADGA